MKLKTENGGRRLTRFSKFPISRLILSYDLILKGNPNLKFHWIIQNSFAAVGAAVGFGNVWR